MQNRERKPLPQLDSSLFDFSTWEAGSLTLLGLRTRFEDLFRHRELVQHYAIGWAHGTSLACRPKMDCRGVMFRLSTGEIFWTHLTEFEFVELFGEEV